jgi:hypothetical protein
MDRTVCALAIPDPLATAWEAPTRGVVMNDKDEILKAYRSIFRTVAYRRVVPLRRFATEQFVFDDQIGHVTVVSNEMPNIPYPVGAELAVKVGPLQSAASAQGIQRIQKRRTMLSIRHRSAQCQTGSAHNMPMPLPGSSGKRR